MNKKLSLYLLTSAIFVGSFIGSYYRSQSIQSSQKDPVAQAHHLIDTAAGDQKKLAEASDLLRKAIESDPENLSALFLQGRVQQQRGFIDLALQSYQKFLQNKISTEFAANYNVAELSELKGDFTSAEKHYIMCVTLAPREESGWERLILLLIKRGQVDKAKSYYQSMLSTVPNSSAAKRLSQIIPQ